MTRASMKAALRAQLLEASGFAPDSVAVGNHQILNKGFDRAIIISNDRWEQTRVAVGGHHQVDWWFDVEVYVRYGDFMGDAVTAMDAAVQAIIDRLNQYPYLDGTTGVFDAFAETGTEVPERIRVGSVNYLVESVSCRVTEMASVTYAE